MLSKIFCILFLLMLSASMAFAKKDIKTVRSIEFKDFNYVSKYEIIDLADIAVKEKNIIIDVNSLEKVLNDLPIIKSFKITEANESLIVSIIENEPIFLLGIRDMEKNMLVELDKEFRIISVNRAHALKMPLIIIKQEDMKDNKISSRLKTFLNLIYNLHSSDLQVMKEIAEIDYTDMLKTKVLLKARRTIFVIRPDKESFNKLNYAAGYFDRIKYYPHTFTILNGFGILE